MAITAKIPIIPHGVLYQGGFSWVGLFFSDLTFSAFHSLTLFPFFLSTYLRLLFGLLNSFSQHDDFALL